MIECFFKHCKDVSWKHSLRAGGGGSSSDKTVLCKHGELSLNAHHSYDSWVWPASNTLLQGREADPRKSLSSQTS